MTCVAGNKIGLDACPKCGAAIDEDCKSPLIVALKAARPYVETCSDDSLPNHAAEVLKKIDAAIGL